MRAKYFIKTSVNATETKIDEGAWKKISCAKIQAYFWKNMNKIPTTFHLFYALLFLANLVFKFNIVLIGIFVIISTTISLSVCLLINIWYITNPEVYPVPLRFFIRTSKILIKLGVLILKVFSLKMFLLCSHFFMKNVYLIMAKINLDVNNCL